MALTIRPAPTAVDAVGVGACQCVRVRVCHVCLGESPCVGVTRVPGGTGQLPCRYQISGIVVFVCLARRPQSDNLAGADFSDVGVWQRHLQRGSGLTLLHPTERVDAQPAGPARDAA